MVTEDAENHHDERPAEAANFPGSLVVNQLESLPRRHVVPLQKGNGAAWLHYFSGGWDDLGIWKSAVRF